MIIKVLPYRGWGVTSWDVKSPWVYLCLVLMTLTSSLTSSGRTYLAKCSNTPPYVMDTSLSVICLLTFSLHKWHQNLAPGSNSPSSTEGLWRYFLTSST
jgi:hypothetical protein